MTPFFRVDSRLVHGQIIATWMPHLRLQRVAIVHDDVPRDELQLTMFRMAIPGDLAFDALTVRDAAAWLNQRRFGHDRTLVLMQTVADADRLFRAGHPFSQLNIGNLHYGPGRIEVTPSVFLGPDEVELLRGLARRGVLIEVRSLPTEPPASIADLLA